MKKYKQFIAGFVTCAILLSFIFIPGYAEDVLKVLANPFPIVLNGETIKVDALNVNGSTYMKFVDIAKCLGTPVTFNNELKQIEVNTNKTEGKTLITATSKIEFDSATGLPVGGEYVDIGYTDKAIKYDGKLYVTRAYLQNKYNINYKSINGLDVTYEKGDKQITINIKGKSNLFYIGAVGYYNIELFKELAGE